MAATVRIPWVLMALLVFLEQGIIPLLYTRLANGPTFRGIFGCMVAMIKVSLITATFGNLNLPSTSGLGLMGRGCRVFLLFTAHKVFHRLPITLVRAHGAWPPGRMLMEIYGCLV